MGDGRKEMHVVVRPAVRNYIAGFCARWLSFQYYMELWLNSLNKQFSGIRVLSDVSADFAPGTIVALLGSNGSGKTTLLNALSCELPPSERIITIEDTPELRLNQPHVARMETRDANVEGKGRIDYRDLVTNALRQRPDRIIVGECRDAAAFDMLQAMTTGHDGSLTTIHADNCREVPTRLRTLVQQANTGMSSREILEYISQAIDFIIYTERSHGVRRVTEIAEVQGMQGDVVTIAPIVRFEHDPNDPEHSGWFVPTGERFMRRHIEKMANEGVYVDDDWFNPQAVF